MGCIISFYNFGVRQGLLMEKVHEKNSRVLVSLQWEVRRLLRLHRDSRINCKDFVRTFDKVRCYIVGFFSFEEVLHIFISF